MKLGTFVAAVYLVGFASGISATLISDLAWSLLSTVGWAIVLGILCVSYFKSNE